MELAQTFSRGWRRSILAALMAVAVTLPAIPGSAAFATETVTTPPTTTTPAPSKLPSAKELRQIFEALKRAPWVNSETPVTLELVNDCNGEAVSVSGVLKTRMRTVDLTLKDGNRLYWYEFHSDYGKLRGVSASGRKYIADGEGHRAIFNYGTGPQYTGTVSEFELKGQGPKNDFKVTTTFFMKLGPEGAMLQEINDTKTRCK